MRVVHRIETAAEDADAALSAHVGTQSAHSRGLRKSL
jgi:hypothetical protein